LGLTLEESKKFWKRKEESQDQKVNDEEKNFPTNNEKEILSSFTNEDGGN